LISKLLEDCMSQSGEDEHLPLLCCRSGVERR
jgi:hypothetical protein